MEFYGYNSINLNLGYPTFEIRSPKEMIDYEDNEKEFRIFQPDTHVAILFNPQYRNPAIHLHA
jgi:hypothetical protein